eukprot:5055713-Amphidinium_carterae.1
MQIAKGMHSSRFPCWCQFLLPGRVGTGEMQCNPRVAAVPTNPRQSSFARRGPIELPSRPHIISTQTCYMNQALYPDPEQKTSQTI